MNLKSIIFKDTFPPSTFSFAVRDELSRNELRCIAVKIAETK